MLRFITQQESAVEINTLSECLALSTIYSFTLFQLVQTISNISYVGP